MAKSYLGGHQVTPALDPGNAAAGVRSKDKKSQRGHVLQAAWDGPEMKLIKAGEEKPADVVRVSSPGKASRKASRKRGSLANGND
jgi:hypothetical protein